MSKVTLHRSGMPDKLLGRVNDDGRVYRSEPGPDDQIGKADLHNGKIYASRLGPDRYLGRVDLSNGRVYRHVSGAPDKYVGRINEDGRMDQHDALSPDDYLGKLKKPQSLAHTAAAFLLLVLPESESAPKN